MTNEEKLNSTKRAIIDAANVLFAKNGYDGTSVRDIAQTAGVNLAAINYHFKNKENLYWRVFDNNYDWMKEGIEKLGDEFDNTSDLAVAVYDYFLGSSSALMNTFRIFLSDSVRVPDEWAAEHMDERFGPPGQDVFIEKIRAEVGDNVPEESQRWAMKMIFGLLVHYGVVSNTSLMKEKSKTQEDVTPEAIKASLYHSVKAHLEYIKNNPELK